jgi:NAD(P)-dependent dehydrogenase (short-subunit alcohol dehydrogenase family)
MSTRSDELKAKSPPPQRQSQQPGRQTQMTPAPETIRADYRGSGKLEGKHALISGGDSGIGRAVAVHFAREGADVALIYLDEDDDADETEELVSSEGVRCLKIKGDVSKPDFCARAVEQVVDEFGSLEILVNNAAQQYPQEDVKEISFEQLEKTFHTNIFGYIFLAQNALKHLRKGGCIINTGSVTASRGSPKLVDYSATKGAIEAMTYSLALQVVDKGIRVNGVAPGPIWTPLIPASFSKEQVEKFGQDTPMGRPGQPAEVAPAYVYLASEDASYVTGQFIHVNGGSYLS